MFDTIHICSRDLPELLKLSIYIFSLLITAVVFLKLSKKKRTRGFFNSFYADLSLIKLIQRAITAVFSRWWLVVVPLAIVVTVTFQSKLSAWMFMEVNPELKQQLEHPLEPSDQNYELEILSSHEWPLDKVASIINKQLDNPLEIWELQIFLYLGIILEICALVWLYRVYRQKPGLTGPYSLKIMVAFGIFLIIGITSDASMIFPLDKFQHEVDFIFYIYHPLIFILPMAGLFPLFCMWFVAVYNAGKKWDRNLRDEDLDRNNGGGIFPAGEVFSVFPVFIFLFCVQSILVFCELLSGYAMIDFLNPFNISFLTNYSDPIWETFTNSLDIVVSWALFPLPFIAARNRVGMRESLSMLKKTWQAHFNKLTVLAIVIVTVKIIYHFLLEIYYYIKALIIPISNNTLDLWSFPDPVLLVITAIGVILGMITFLLVAVAFHSGKLDLPCPTPNHT